MADTPTVSVDPDYRALAYLIPVAGITPRVLPVVQRVASLADVVMRPIDGVRATDHEAEGASVRVYEPSATSAPAALLWVHGGGLVLGSPRMDDQRCSILSAALGITVVSAAYRTAPQHPYPAALDDCAAAWTWLQAHATELGIDPQRVVLGGASAGGGLAAALTQRLRDEGAPQPRGQLLVYPMLDDRTAAATSLDGVGHIVLDQCQQPHRMDGLSGKVPGPSDGTAVRRAGSLQRPRRPPAGMDRCRVVRPVRDGVPHLRTTAARLRRPGGPCDGAGRPARLRRVVGAKQDAGLPGGPVRLAH